MRHKIEGHYIDESSRKKFFIEVENNEGDSSGLFGIRFVTQCGLSASAITLNDGRQGMILEDKTVLSRVSEE